MFRNFSRFGFRVAFLSPPAQAHQTQQAGALSNSTLGGMGTDDGGAHGTSSVPYQRRGSVMSVSLKPCRYIQ